MNELLVAVLVLVPLVGGLAVWSRAGRTAERLALGSTALVVGAGLSLAGSALAGGPMSLSADSSSSTRSAPGCSS